MKVKELIEFLKTKNPDFEVILSKDSEGNSHSPLSDLSDEMYEADSTWHGNIICKDDTDDDFEYEVNSVVLHPVN